MHSSILGIPKLLPDNEKAPVNSIESKKKDQFLSLTTAASKIHYLPVTFLSINQKSTLSPVRTQPSNSKEQSNLELMLSIFKYLFSTLADSKLANPEIRISPCLFAYYENKQTPLEVYPLVIPSSASIRYEKASP